MDFADKTLTRATAALPITPGTTQAANPPGLHSIAPSGLQWIYGEHEDEMTSKKNHTASVLSENTVTFGFPYGEPQRGKLTLRRHARLGTDVIVRIERGQILLRFV